MDRWALGEARRSPLRPAPRRSGRRLRPAPARRRTSRSAVRRSCGVPRCWARRPRRRRRRSRAPSPAAPPRREPRRRAQAPARRRPRRLPSVSASGSGGGSCRSAIVGSRRVPSSSRDLRLLHELRRRLSQRIRRLLVAWPVRLTERLVLELLSARNRRRRAGASAPGALGWPRQECPWLGPKAGT